MTLRGASASRRITVRLRPAEIERLDALVERLQHDRRYRKPYARGRLYGWSRSDVVRLALEQLGTVVSDED